jgi:coenzyme F420-reducing hydrogenase delta subunit
MAGDVERPIVCFYCKECAGAAISLSGLRHDAYPTNVRLIELPCLGRVSALHIVEAARLGAAGVILAGCAEGRCQFRDGATSAAAQAALAGELLADAGMALPLELWNLCAVDRDSVGRRIRLFCASAEGDDAAAAMLAAETDRIDQPTGAASLVGAASVGAASVGAASVGAAFVGTARPVGGCRGCQ